MASKITPTTPEVISDSNRTSLAPSSSGSSDSGRQNGEPTGGVHVKRMLTNVLQENIVIDGSNEGLLDMEEDEVQVIFEDIRRPGSDQNKPTGSQVKEVERLTQENESLRKELAELKLEVAHEKSRKFISQHEQHNQILDVLNSELCCAICSEILIEAVAIECGHIFCSQCLSTWFYQQPVAPSCPKCRTANCKDPIKICNWDGTIASLHTLLSPEVQSDRQQLLEDRKTERKKTEEALAASRARRTQGVDITWESLVRGQPLSPLVQRVRPETNTPEERSPGLGQPASIQPRAGVDPYLFYSLLSQGVQSPGQPIVSRAAARQVTD